MIAYVLIMHLPMIFGFPHILFEDSPSIVGWPLYHLCGRRYSGGCTGRAWSNILSIALLQHFYKIILFNENQFSRLLIFNEF